MRAVVLRTRWLLSVLLLAGAALFVIGVAAERNRESNHQDHETAAAHVEAAEEAEHDEAAEAAERSTTADEAAERGEDQETVLGINVEGTPLVVIGALASVAFAALVWFRREHLLLWTVAAFAALSTVFDVAELAHQINEHRTGIALIAAVLAIVHAAATLVAETRATNQTATP